MEDAGVVDPTEDGFCFFEAAFGKEFVDAEHGVSGEGVEVGWRTGDDVNCKGACGVEAVGVVVKIGGDGDHVLYVDVACAEVVVGDSDEGGFSICERDGSGEALWRRDVVLVRSFGGGGVPGWASEEVGSDVGDCFRDDAPFGGAGLAAEWESEGHREEGYSLDDDLDEVSGAVATTEVLATVG